MRSMVLPLSIAHPSQGLRTAFVTVLCVPPAMASGAGVTRIGGMPCPNDAAYRPAELGSAGGFGRGRLGLCCGLRLRRLGRGWVGRSSRRLGIGVADRRLCLGLVRVGLGAGIRGGGGLLRAARALAV